jgi:hypothetical protein
MKNLLTSTVLALGLTAGSAQAADTHIIDLNARDHTPDNPVTVFFEAGTYRVMPVMPEDGALYTGHHAWGGATTGCDADGTNCRQGWQLRMFFTAPDMGMTPSYYREDLGEYYTCLSPYTLEQFDSGEVSVNFGHNPTLFATPELAVAAAREYGGCEVTFETSGTVTFWHGDSFHGDNLGGNSFRFEKVVEQVPELAVAAAPAEPEPVTDEQWLQGFLDNGVEYSISTGACDAWQEFKQIREGGKEHRWGKQYIRRHCQTQRWAERKADRAEHRIVKTSRKALRALDRGEIKKADRLMLHVEDLLDQITDYEEISSQAADEASNALDIFLAYGPVEIDEDGNAVVSSGLPFGGTMTISGGAVNNSNSNANNGHGNGDQDAPGNSCENNNAENADCEDDDDDDDD